jgi:mRNA interferase HicA
VTPCRLEMHEGLQPRASERPLVGCYAELDGAGIRVHQFVYTTNGVKRRDLEKRLSECGWRFLRSGRRHDVWTDGEREEAVPRHREINERLAQAILRRACKERT